MFINIAKNFCKFVANFRAPIIQLDLLSLYFLICVLHYDWSEGALPKMELTFQPNLPVVLNSKVILEVSQSLPGLSLSMRGAQSFSALMSLHNDSGLPITRPPFELTFTLKSIKIDLNANDEKISFDSNTKDASLYLSQLAHLLDRPIQIKIADHFEVQGDNQALWQFINELPMLKEVNSQNLLAELFLHLFALGGHDLAVGQTYLRCLQENAISSLPERIEYKVTAIDDYHVIADISGKIEKRKLQLKGFVHLGENAQTPLEATLLGALSGNVIWNRDNAMLYQLKMEYDYSVMWKIGDWEWMMKVFIQVHNKTTL
jgi:hypothetical protein